MPVNGVNVCDPLMKGTFEEDPYEANDGTVYGRFTVIDDGTQLTPCEGTYLVPVSYLRENYYGVFAEL